MGVMALAPEAPPDEPALPGLGVGRISLGPVKIPLPVSVAALLSCMVIWPPAATEWMPDGPAAPSLKPSPCVRMRAPGTPQGAG